jgi:hypothetical protein
VAKKKSHHTNPEQEERWKDRPENRRRQAARMRARRLMEKEGKVKKHDNKDVDHIKPIGGKGGKIDNSRKTLRVVDSSTNRKRQPKQKGR